MTWIQAVKAVAAKINATGLHWSAEAVPGGWVAVCKGAFTGYTPQPNPASY